MTRNNNFEAIINQIQIDNKEQIASLTELQYSKLFREAENTDSAFDEYLRDQHYDESFINAAIAWLNSDDYFPVDSKVSLLEYAKTNLEANQYWFFNADTDEEVEQLNKNFIAYIEENYNA